MGSFNVTCAISGLPITGGDPVKLLTLVEYPFSDHGKGASSCYCYERFYPMTIPIDAEYYDYGDPQKIDDSSIAMKALLISYRKCVVSQPLGENTCHDVKVSRDGDFDHFQTAATEGRLRMRGQIFDHAAWTRRKIQQGMPTQQRIERILTTAGISLTDTKGGFLVDRRRGGGYRVRMGGYEHNVEGLQGVHAILGEYYSVRIIKKPTENYSRDQPYLWIRNAVCLSEIRTYLQSVASVERVSWDEFMDQVYIEEDDEGTYVLIRDWTGSIGKYGSGYTIAEALSSQYQTRLTHDEYGVKVYPTYKKEKREKSRRLLSAGHVMIRTDVWNALVGTEEDPKSYGARSFAFTLEEVKAFVGKSSYTDTSKRDRKTIKKLLSQEQAGDAQATMLLSVFGRDPKKRELDPEREMVGFSHHQIGLPDVPFCYTSKTSFYEGLKYIGMNKLAMDSPEVEKFIRTTAEFVHVNYMMARLHMQWMVPPTSGQEEYWQIHHEFHAAVSRVAKNAMDEQIAERKKWEDQDAAENNDLGENDDADDEGQDHPDAQEN